MFVKRLKKLAETIGLACFALLALYGMITLWRGDLAQAARLMAPLAQQSGWNATVPTVMNYQGTLRDVEGNPLSGYYTMTFRVYDDVIAPLTDTLWSETHVSVTVRGGHFNVLLGNIEPVSNSIPADLFNDPDRFIGVEVQPYDEMVPRQRFASVPYAFHAHTALDATYSITAEYAVNAGDGVPIGAIIIWDQTANCPNGYTEVAELSDRFVVGIGDYYGTDVQQTGGVAGHTHLISWDGHHGHGMDGPSDRTEGKQRNDNHGRAADTGHTHSIHGSGGHNHGGNTGASDPPYYTVVFCRKN